MNTAAPVNESMKSRPEREGEVEPVEATTADASGSGRAILGVEAAGGDIGNTPPSNRHSRLETGGEDTAEIALYVNWPDERLEVMADILASAQRAARGDDEGFVGDIVGIDGHEFTVLPAGAKGRGSKSPYYAWVLDYRGLRLKVANRPEPHETIPNITVTAGSLLLMEQGLTNVWQMIQEAVEALGADIERNKLTRIDAAADLPEMDVAVFTTAGMQKRVITRATKRAFYMSGDTPTGITCGSGNLMVRMYDKAREVNEKQDEQKQRYLERHRWGGPQSKAVRVEYQLRRECLKSFDIDTVTDWLDKRASVLEYLTDGWCRVVTSCDKANGNQKRATNTREWNRVREAFRTWAGQADAAKRTKDPKPEAEALTKQALGCMMSAYALTQEDLVEDIDEVFAYLSEKLYGQLQAMEEKAIERVNRKRKDYEAIGRAEPTRRPPGYRQAG